MKSISLASIQTLGVNGAYERGLAYYNEGRVGDLTVEGFRITGEVVGTRTYHVTLHHTAKVFEGECTCPASNNFDFCKHCAAAALRYYYQTQTNQELAESSGSNLLTDYLDTLTKPELAHALHDLIIKDMDVLDLWQLKAEISSGGLTGASIRKRITKAIPYKPSGLWRYRDVANYFDDCELALSVLTEPLFALPPKEASKLVRYAAQRLEKTLETIDDSGGYRFATEERLQQWMMQVLVSDDWQIKQRIDFVTELLLDKNYHYDVGDLSRLTLAQFDKEQTIQIYKKIESQWLGLTPENPEHSKEQYYYERLEALLLEQARANNDFAQELKILERGAVTVRRCLNLVDLCIKHQKTDDAGRWLSYASKIKQLSVHDVYDIESAQIDLFKAQKDYDRALEIEWTRFDEQENLDLLKKVLRTANTLGQELEWLDKGLELLTSRLDKTDLSQKNRARAATLAYLYLDYDRIDKAIALSKTSLLRSDMLMAIVDSMKIINETTFRLLERATNLHLNTTGQTVYEQAVEFLQNQHRRFGHQHQAQFDRSINAIFSEPRNLRKTNFIKLLKSAFPESFIKD